MLGRTHRFHGYGSLNSVYRCGKNARSSLITLRYARRSAGRPYRMAVVVSRKVSKSAVVRNRIRRRIYETVRHNAQEVSPGTDLVFTVFSEQVADLPASNLKIIVTELLKKSAANQ